jgi:hypothetical protein
MSLSVILLQVIEKVAQGFVCLRVYKVAVAHNFSWRIKGVSHWHSHIGIADNVGHSSPGHHPSPFVVYYPFNQQPERFEILLARTVGDPAGLASAVREAVASIDSTVPISDAMTYDDLISSRFSTRRVGVVLVSSKPRT